MHVTQLATVKQKNINCFQKVHKLDALIEHSVTLNRLNSELDSCIFQQQFIRVADSRVDPVRRLAVLAMIHGSSSVSSASRLDEIPEDYNQLCSQLAVM